MKPKHLAYVALFTLGAIPVTVWLWRKVHDIPMGSVSEAWLNVQAAMSEPDPLIF